MVKTTQNQSFSKAYTIIESLVVLAILAVLTVVIIALLKHEKAPAEPTGKDSTSLSENLETLPSVENEAE